MILPKCQDDLSVFQSQIGKDTGFSAQGPQGEKGEPGDTGPKGDTPEISINTQGNWVINGQDTGFSAHGSQGKTGEPGVDGITPHIDSATGNWFIGDANTGINAQGPEGPPGPDGDTGPRGPIGSGGSIIPFTTGHVAIATSGITGLRSDVVVIGFGNFKVLTAETDDPIKLPSAFNVLSPETWQLAFSVPEDGVITALSLFISVGAAQPVVDANIFFKVYRSTIPDNTFYPIEETAIGPFKLIHSSAIGTMFKDNLSNLNIPVSAGTRLIFVAYHTSPGATSSPSLYYTGGLKIAAVEPDTYRR